MKLSELVKSITISSIEGSADKSIAHIESDSRKVTQDTLFVAIKGTQSDGHNYIPTAIAQGAIAIVCTDKPATTSPNVTYIVVKDTNEALGCLASAWYGNPSHELILIGVTGTNGKTTIATLLYELVRKMGKRVGLLSTVCNYIDAEPSPATHTTPDPLALNKLLRAMVDAGCQYTFMEVSSHAIDQRRIAGLDFDGGVFTNLTRDHLDYHHTVEEYLKAKKRFFDDLPDRGFAITNIDDKVGKVMLQNSAARHYHYSLRTLADYKARIIESHFDGTQIEINGRELNVMFVGKFNVYNLLAVYATAIQLGFDSEQVLLQMSTLASVSGRFQSLRSSSGINCIVDYAHTPDALINVLTTITEVLGNNGSIITVVGCGGNRDKGKRPIMAKEAVQRSGRVIITSDNPRNEEPQDIINDMLQGLDAQERKRTLVIADRSEAIRTAITLATPSDVVLIAGKGHETYQEIKGVRHHFDDREEVLSM